MVWVSRLPRSQFSEVSSKLSQTYRFYPIKCCLNCFQGLTISGAWHAACVWYILRPQTPVSKVSGRLAQNVPGLPYKIFQKLVSSLKNSQVFSAPPSALHMFRALGRRFRKLATSLLKTYQVRPIKCCLNGVQVSKCFALVCRLQRCVFFEPSDAGLEAQRWLSQNILGFPYN